ncbi:hypothetical protein KHA93_08915 [Bacillus sp. FJAT-49732]|uniref:Uncharacterized protein n=1 Tax=Lederbergia citrisecunda TaxID=2833583 RepID=A0A942YMY2_9BACI|nr:hypothetical protein [Lederbergia citrisecunda]MBS4199776.1 hypothetical protein [Lederbergia citrisecunda]
MSKSKALTLLFLTQILILPIFLYSNQIFIREKVGKILLIFLKWAKLTKNGKEAVS